MKITKIDTVAAADQTLETYRARGTQSNKGTATMTSQHTTGSFSIYENAPGNKHRFLILDSAGETVAMTTGDPDHAPDYYRAQANARVIVDALNRATGAA